MKFSIKKSLRWVLMAAAVIFAVAFLWQRMDMAAGTEIYDEAAQLAFSEEGTDQLVPSVTPAPAGTWVPAPVEEEDKYMDQLRELDFDALREVNPEVVGWILIPGSKVNYPIMKGEDNEEYLRHAWTGKRNYVGSIFVEHLNSPDLTDYHTIIYGHNMNNGDMFGQLRKFRESGYRKKTPYIYVANDEGVFRYEVFSTYRAGVESDTYRVGFSEPKERADFLIHCLKSDTGNYGIFPEPTDRILTLSTCTTGGYSRRYVVQARLSMIKVTEATADIQPE